MKRFSIFVLSVGTIVLLGYGVWDRYLAPQEVAASPATDDSALAYASILPAEHIPPKPLDASTTKSIFDATLRSLGVVMQTTTSPAKVVSHVISVLTKPRLPVLPIAHVVTSSSTINAFIANTESTQELGLGERDSLPKDEGMLFVFPRLGRYGFWMKDMHFPIDIIWINKMKKVVSISYNVAVDSYPNIFYPAAPVKYVLEMNAGGAKEYNIASGTILKF